MKKLLLISMIGCLLLTGCGSSKSSIGNAAMPTMSEAASFDYSYSNDVVAEESYTDSWYESESDISMAEPTDTTVTFAEGKKIIYQSNVILETKTYTETYNKLTELINENGGYIEYENYNNEKRSYLANNNGKGTIVIATNELTIRIPSKNYSKFMQDGLELGNVLQRNQTIQDKTSEYNTNKSYVDILNDEAEYLAKQLEVLENELKAAQANDKHYDEIIVNMKDIAERKAQVEKELVPYKSIMDDIDEKVEYSTITMELREVDKFTVIEVEDDEEPTFLEQIAESWNNAMSNLGNLLKGTLIFLITIIPGVVYIALLGLVVLCVLTIIKKIKKVSSIKDIFKKRPITKTEQVVIESINKPEDKLENKTE